MDVHVNVARSLTPLAVVSNVTGSEQIYRPGRMRLFDPVMEPPTERLLERYALLHAVPDVPRS